MNRVIIYGAGGQAHDVLWWLKDSLKRMEKSYEIIGFIDDNEKLRNKNIGDYEVLGDFKFLEEHLNDVEIVISIANPFIRAKIVEKVSALGMKYFTIIHPTALLGENVVIGENSVIAPGTIITSDSKIGYGNYISIGCAIGHGVKMGKYVNLNPKAIIGGQVQIGDFVNIGMGTLIKENVKIGSNVFIGLGSIVINDIPDDVFAIGSPVRPIRKFKWGNKLL